MRRERSVFGFRPPRADAALMAASLGPSAKRSKMAATDASSLKSWVEYDASKTHFPIQNVPFGVFVRPDGRKVCGTRIGDKVRRACGAATRC